MRYDEIVNKVKLFAQGFTPADMYRTLHKISIQLKKLYGVEPVDIVAAICLMEKGNYEYARILLKRAYRDLVRIGKERGWL